MKLEIGRVETYLTRERLNNIPRNEDNLPIFHWPGRSKWMLYRRVVWHSTFVNERRQWSLKGRGGWAIVCKFLSKFAVHIVYIYGPNEFTKFRNVDCCQRDDHMSVQRKYIHICKTPINSHFQTEGQTTNMKMTLISSRNFCGCLFTMRNWTGKWSLRWSDLKNC